MTARANELLTCLFVFIFLCFSSSSVAAEVKKTRPVPARITPAIMPLWSDGPVGKELGFGIVDRAGAILLSTGEYNHIHIKQILSAARRHGWTLKELSTNSVAKKMAAILGAGLVVVGRLSPGGDDGFKLSLMIEDLRTSKSKHTEILLPKDIAASVVEGSMAVASLVASIDSVSVPRSDNAHPDCDLSKAMSAYLACASVLIEQPMGLRKSHTVNPARLKGARKKCEMAVKFDPHFGAAWALLSLTHSMALDGEQAAKALVQANKTRGYLPFDTLASYWLATRFGSSAKGAEVLRDAVGKYPGALIFRTYLGEHLNITHKYSNALDVWESYLDIVPHSPYAIAQKAYSLARLGKLNEAISLTRKAVEMDKDSLELKLELASRLVDAGDLKEAERILLPLAGHARVYGELLLRLGYIYLLEKKDTKAEKWFNKALDLAKGPNEWRTRGRTHYDLAIVYVRKGKLTEAERHLLDAAKEGFLMRDILKTNPELQVLANRSKVRHLFHNPDLKLKSNIFSTSPFPLNDAGGVEPDAKRTAITGFTF